MEIYLVGDMARLTAAEANVCALIAPDYEADQSGMLFFCRDQPPIGRPYSTGLSGISKAVAAILFAPLPHKFGGWSSRNRPYLSADQGEVYSSMWESV